MNPLHALSGRACATCAATLVFFSLAGCAPSANDAAARGDEQDFTQVSNEDPATFYDRFLYTSEKSGGVTWHTYPQSERVDLGNGLEGALRLYMKPDKTVVVAYAEYEKGTMRRQHLEELPARWSVDGYQLVVEGLGEATGMIGPGPELLMRVSRDFKTPGVAQKQLRFSLVTSTSGPKP